jgi:hypothetical protein
VLAAGNAGRENGYFQSAKLNFANVVSITEHILHRARERDLMRLFSYIEQKVKNGISGLAADHFDARRRGNQRNKSSYRAGFSMPKSPRFIASLTGDSV